MALLSPPVTPPVPPTAPPVLPPPPKWHDVTVVRKKKTARCVISPVPPEEFGISRFARDIKNCGYCFHEVIKTQGSLVAEGYDPNQIANISTYTAQTNQEELARDSVEERTGQNGDGGLNEMNRKVKITEHYVYLDYEQNGKPAMYRITTGGDPSQILKRKMGKSSKYAEEIVRLDGPAPFAAITPIPVPHRFFGRSLADVTIEIQKIKTAIIRGMLTNVYMRNNPRVEVPETHASESTVDDLMAHKPGGIVRTRAPGGVNWQEVPDITQTAYPMLSYLDTVREWRSGVSRQGQGVDGNALQNQVATIANQMLDASQSKIKLIARIFAQTGMRDLFWLVHHTLRKYGNQPQTIRLRNKWIDVDPRLWKSRDDMTVNVGLGGGDKARDLAMLQVLVGWQTQAVDAGLVSQRNLFNSAKEGVRLVRPGADVNTFFTEPGTPPDPNDPASAPLPPRQDPKHKEADAAAQEIQGRLAIEAAAAQHDAQNKQYEMAVKDKQATAQIAVSQSESQAKAALAQQEFQFKQQLELLREQRDQARHDQEARHREELHQANLSKMRNPVRDNG